MGFNTLPCNPYPISTEELNSNKANQITIAPFFNAETAYEVGDLVYYNGLIYRCTNDHEGEWDADDFATTTISNELATLKSGLITLHGYTDISSSILDPSLSFTATENCILWLRSSNAENVAPYYNYLVNNTKRGLKGGVGATLDHYVFLRAGDAFKFNDSFPYESTLTNNVYLV